MGKGMQASLAERAEDRADELRAAWGRATGDGVVSAEEVAAIDVVIVDVCEAIGRTNLAQALGMAYIRLGGEARRTRDLLRDLETVSG